MTFYRSLLCAFVVWLGAFSPGLAAAQAKTENAPAETQGQFTASQRKEIIAIVREALKSDPTLLRDAILALQAEIAKEEGAASGQTLADHQKALLHDPLDAVKGNSAGDVMVVEFYDVRCPYCRKMEPALAELLQRDPKIGLVLKEFPILGPPSVLAARALLAAARQNGYFRLREILMQQSAPPSEETLRIDAEQAGLDWKRLRQDMDDPAIQQKIDANLALARAIGIDGTPAFVVGTRLIGGAVPIAELQEAVAAARASQQDKAAR
jgi:protein-disulfide isomerase